MNKPVKMSQEYWDIVFEERLNLIREVLGIKAKDYARNGDRMHNFNRGLTIGEGATREDIIYGFALKHEISLHDIRDDLRAGKLPSKEYVREKFGDAINYLILEEASVLQTIDYHAAEQALNENVASGGHDYRVQKAMSAGTAQAEAAHRILEAHMGAGIPVDELIQKTTAHVPHEWFGAGKSYAIGIGEVFEPTALQITKEEEIPTTPYGPGECPCTNCGCTLPATEDKGYAYGLDEIVKPGNVGEWLVTLPEPYRSQAINNAKKAKRQSVPAPDISGALSTGFNWAESPEGYLYWDGVEIMARNGTLKTPVKIEGPYADGTLSYEGIPQKPLECKLEIGRKESKLNTEHLEENDRVL